MDIERFKQALGKSAEDLQAQESYFCELDAKTGDGDHGVAIAHIAAAICNVLSASQAGSFSELFEELSGEIMTVNGGSIVPIWSMMMDGISEALADEPPTDADFVLAFLRGALSGISSVSGAKAGEKTLVDALLPAIEAAEHAERDCLKMLDAAQAAAKAGAEKTKEMPAKYGRAKNLLDKGVGCLDPGAVSFAAFLGFLYQNLH